MEMLLSKWAPTLLAGLISFFTAWVLKSLEHNRYYKDKRVEHADQTVSHFSEYIESWRKLMCIATLAAERTLTEDEKKRMERYISDRDAAKIELSSRLATLSLYFDGEVLELSRRFRNWDREQAIKRIDQLPDISEWEEWLVRLSTSLKRHV